MLHRVEGIVIRSIEYGEGNVIVTLFTGEFGKVGVMVRGAKKIRSRHAAVTQLYTYGEYVYYKSNSGTLGSLNQGELLDTFPNIRSDLRSTAYAVYFVEMIDRFVPEGEASDFLFAQLKAALESLQAEKDPQIIAYLLEMKLFQFAGISPVSHHCSSCGGSVTGKESVGWSVSTGGTLCLQCGAFPVDRIVIPGTVAKLLRLFQQADLRRIGDIQVKPETKSVLKQIMRGWMEVHSGIRFKSRNVLDQIETAFETD